MRNKIKTILEQNYTSKGFDLQQATEQLLILYGVSQHRELLIAFKEHLDNRDEKGYFITEYVIDEFIESNL